MTAAPGSAVLSPDGLYRYRLTRLLPGPNLLMYPADRHPRAVVAFVMLNPSTADATTDDATLRRLTGYGVRWGSSRLEVANLYAYRTPHPDELEAARAAGVDVIGPDTDRHLEDVLASADLVVAGWGAHQPRTPEARAAHAERIHQVQTLAALHDRPLLALGVTSAGQPRHPLYLKADAEPHAWPPPRWP